MESTVGVTEAQAQFPKLLRELEKKGAITVQRRGKVAAFLISPDRMEAMIETMEVLSSPPAMEAIRDYETGSVEMREASCLDEDPT